MSIINLLSSSSDLSLSLQIPTNIQHCIDSFLNQFPPSSFSSFLHLKVVFLSVYLFLTNKHNKKIDRRGTLESIKNSFTKSVKNHLESDVPLGIFLSGGIDSTSVLSVASQIQNPNTSIEPTTAVRNNSGNEITSPIIGTAYHAPEPGAKKFVEVGKKIKKGDTIMIIEAMKTMNHVPSTSE